MHSDFELNFDPKALQINFTEPLHSFERKNFVNYILHWADNSLMLGHRNSEWCGHAPVLEQDIAISNISLDLIGQARILYQYAAFLINQYKIEGFQEENTEDSLAYLRIENEYKNLLITELPKGHWGDTILRQYFYSVFQKLILGYWVHQSHDEHLTAIAKKFLKEIDYHISWSATWVLRLGDGTQESNSKMQVSLDQVWDYIGEMFKGENFEQEVNKSFDIQLEKVKQNPVLLHFF